MDKHLKYMQLAYAEAQKALNIMEVPVGAVIIKDDMILFLTGDKKNLACPVLIDIKQLTSEELEQINSYIDLFLYDIIC